MKVLVCNPPWYRPAQWGLRSGAEPPRLVPAGSAELPWPHLLAAATGWLLAHEHKAWMVDSIASRESLEGFLERAGELDHDFVLMALSAASLSNDLPLIEAVGERRQVILWWPGKADGAEALLKLTGVRAVVCGEPERGLLAAVNLDEPAVYPSDPIEDLDALPLAYRDYTVHRYRLPLAGLADEPQLHLRVSRGPQRWRGLAAILDELAFLRHNYPRLRQIVVADPAVNTVGERFAELAESLAETGLPWAARVGLETAEAIASVAAASRAAALEVRLEADPSAAAAAALRALAEAGVALTLVSDSASAGDLPAWAQAVGAAATVVRPASSEGSVREALETVLAAGAPHGTVAGRRVFVVGLHQPDYMPPGLVAGARELGLEGIPVDVFNDPREVHLLLDSRPADVAIFDRGVGLPVELIARIAARTVLYSPEILPTLTQTHPHAAQRYAELSPLAPAFDDVVLHDAHPLEYLRARGHQNVRGVVLLPYNPHRLRDRGLRRDQDIVFVGSASEHRERWLAHLREAGLEVAWPQAWGEEFVTVLNRAKIILNLHFTPLPNTELRIVEALACGAFVVSEQPTQPSVFQDGEHFAVMDWDHAAERLQWWLAHDAEREQVAAQGQAYVIAHHTSRHCVAALLALVDEQR